jgi:hypothetical protein
VAVGATSRGCGGIEPHLARRRGGGRGQRHLLGTGCTLPHRINKA